MDFPAKLWRAFAELDYVEDVRPDQHELRAHTPERPYTGRDAKRSMLVIVDPVLVEAKRSETLTEVRRRQEWDDLDDDAAVLEDIVAHLEEGILSAYLGVVELEYVNGYFRPSANNPPRPSATSR